MTLDRVAKVATYAPSVAYANDGLSQAFKTVAGSIAKGIGTKVFWVQTGGYDTHATQNVNAANAGYANLMGTLGNALFAFYSDLKNQGLLQDTLVVQFSEFGRRINENGSAGTDHGAAGLMMVMGGGVHGGLYGTRRVARSLHPAIPRSRTTAATSRTRPTSARSTRGSSTIGSARIRCRCLERTSGRVRSHSFSLGFLGVPRGSSGVPSGFLGGSAGFVRVPKSPRVLAESSQFNRALGWQRLEVENESHSCLAPALREPPDFRRLVG